MLQILGYGSVPLPSPILDVRHYAGQSHLPHREPFATCRGNNAISELLKNDLTMLT
jgi:hypothetical protein